MSSQRTPSTLKQAAPPEASEMPDVTAVEDEVTDVMDRKDLPDFGVEGASAQHRKRPPNRPSTFTRLLLDKRR